MLMSNVSGESTSAVAHREVLKDSKFLDKQAALILAVHFGGPSTPDEICELTGLRDVYVRPRLSDMADFEILQIAGRSINAKSGKAANKLRICEPWATMLAESPEDELETLAKAVFVECKAEFDRQSIENAFASGLIG